jgi:hypothetical protein
MGICPNVLPAKPKELTALTEFLSAGQSSPLHHSMRRMPEDASAPVPYRTGTFAIRRKLANKTRRARSRNPGSPRHTFLPHPPQQPRDDTQRPLPQYSLPPINQIHDHKLPRRHYSALSPEISTRLFQTYFNSIHPLWPILYKPLYASLDYASPSNMPPALVAAIYAIASCVDKSQPFANSIVQKYPDPQDFFEEALDLLQQDGNGQGGQCILNIFTPSITACQVLAILLLQQHGLAEFSRAAMLCGLASSMAIEMRIHRADSTDPVQAEVRSRLWWNLYILEKMISCETGKPVLLRSEESDCRYPSVSEADEFELMSLYARSPRPSDQFRNTSIKLRTISVLHTSVRLAFILERISRGT